MKELPEHITTPYPYLHLMDLDSAIRGIAPDFPDHTLRSIERRMIDLQRRYAPTESSFYTVDAAELSERLSLTLERELARTDALVGVIAMDKDMLRGDRPDVFHISVSRSAEGPIVARVGSGKGTPHEQIQNMVRWAIEANFDEVIFADDVLAFGDTLPTFMLALREAVPTPKLRVLAGIAASEGVWRGIQVVHEATGVVPEYLVRVEASPEIPNGSRGMAIPTARDLTFLGGKASEQVNGIPSLVPYFLPFSQPLQSIIRSGSEHEASLSYLYLSQDIVRSIERHRGGVLRLADLALNGYGIPRSVHPDYQKAVEPLSLDQSVQDYLLRAAQILG